MKCSLRGSSSILMWSYFRIKHLSRACNFTSFNSSIDYYHHKKVCIAYSSRPILYFHLHVFLNKLCNWSYLVYRMGLGEFVGHIPLLNNYCKRRKDIPFHKVGTSNHLFDPGIFRLDIACRCQRSSHTKMYYYTEACNSARLHQW